MECENEREARGTRRTGCAQFPAAPGSVYWAIHFLTTVFSNSLTSYCGLTAGGGLGGAGAGGFGCVLLMYTCVPQPDLWSEPHAADEPRTMQALPLGFFPSQSQTKP